MIQLARQRNRQRVAVKSGNRRWPYAVKVSGGYVIQKVLSCHATAKEAQEALDQFNERRRAGLAPEVEQINMTVQQVFDAWSAREYPKLKPASIISHFAAWNKRTSAMRPGSSARSHWTRVTHRCEARLSQSLINNDAVLIKALNRYARRRDIISKDYSSYLEIPTVGPKREKFWISSWRSWNRWPVISPGLTSH